MAVDFEAFLAWAKNRFGEENIKIKETAHGTEICTHSYFAERAGIPDSKFHLWMNPSGGKSNHPEWGSFRCWKTDEQGSLVRLVAEWDKLDWDEAEHLICGASSLRSLEQKVHEFFGQFEMPTVIEEAPVVAPVKFDLPDYCYLIDKMGVGHFMRIKAKQYLASRKIPTEGLYVCIGGEYKDRIVIPYYDMDNALIYFNARTMSKEKNVLRYKKAPAEVVNQNEVLFMTDWPEGGSKIYLMEGEFDAISLKQAGYSACALGGKAMSDEQMEMLRGYTPVLAFDSDEGGFKRDTGLQATITIGMQLLENGFPVVYYVRPPKVYKDWNKLLVEHNPETIQKYIEKFERPFTESTPTILKSKAI